MKIYNTLSRKKEALEKKKIGIYVCGPTVYDEPHIGHARSAYVFDVIRQYLKYKGLDVTFVRNVTDVDDKVIDKAKKELGHVWQALDNEKKKEKLTEVSKKYLDLYHESMQALGIEKPNKEPRAIKYIPRIIKFIQLLIKKGRAYEADGDVYFDIKKAENYGKLSNQNLEKMESGARISPGEKKKDPLDFALWKKAKEAEPSWESPWSEGRPGWHIECSVMSLDILGEEFDIHGGGIDLVFPHHENEIAQSEAAGKKFAKLWMHNGLLTTGGEKMAKSLGNFITIGQFSKSLDLLKLLFISSHYRHPVDFTEDKLEQMRKAKDRILAFLQKADTALGKYKKMGANWKNGSCPYFSRFTACMDDDFNTPLALSVIFKCVDDGNKILEKKNLGKKDKIMLCNALLFIRDVAKNIFNLKLDYKIPDSARKTIIEAKIMEREKARKNKDFKKADEIRNELLRQGIILEDTKEGPKWRRKL